MDNKYLVPHDFRPGVLNRETCFGKLKTREGDVPVLRESIGIVPQEDWRDALEEYKPTCRELIWNTYSQGSVGSCASEGFNKSLETIREYRGYKRIEFNPYFAYHTVSGGRDGGSSLDSNVKFGIETGACPRSVWDRNKGWRREPSEEAYEAAYNYRLDECFDIDNTNTRQFHLEIGSALLKGFCVYAGYTGHAILLITLVYKNGTWYAEYQNSWGSSWGDNGKGLLKFSSIRRGYGAFVPRTTTFEALST